MPDPKHEVAWPRLSEFVSERIGLHFPRERWGDLERGLADAAREFGFANVGACAHWLLSGPPTRECLQVLASHLTVGETYFFRDPQVLAVLADDVLPGLIRARRGREQRLRIWSAACASGEEPYSLAILLHQLLPDLEDWQVTITATDVNVRALHKAAAGTYGAWSFRAAPAGFQERYFRRTADGRFTILPGIARLVTFAHLNLVEDTYPSLATGTNAMDLVFCRNVLMYFTAPQIRKVVGNLHHALVDDGWLVVSPSEASHTLFRKFATVNYPGVILYRKGPAGTVAETETETETETEAGMVGMAGLAPEPPYPAFQPADDTATVPGPEAPEPAQPPPEPLNLAQSLYAEGRYAEAADLLAASVAGRSPAPPVLSLLARSCANRGDLDGALAWCGRWIATDKLDRTAHYLRAIVLLERGDAGPARASLQRAIYLDPGFVLAHFALGTLARRARRGVEAARHFANALALLRASPPDEILPASDGLAAGRLAETITAMIATERAS